METKQSKIEYRIDRGKRLYIYTSPNGEFARFVFLVQL